MPDPALLSIAPSLPVEACNGGLFVSRGVGAHPRRIIDSWEIILVRSGTLSIREENSDFRIAPGQVLILQPGRRHEGSAPYPPDLSFFWLHFRIRPAPRAAGPPFAIPQTTTLAAPERMMTYWRRFLDDQESGRLNPLQADLLVMLILSELAPAADGGAAAPAGAAGLPATRAAIAARAETLIRTRFHQQISASAIARILRCNPDYLGRVFRSVYGQSLTEAIHRRRIAQAARQLVETTDRIDEIAARCGFPDSGYFRRLFRRYEGISPRAYRRLYARLHVNTV